MKKMNRQIFIKQLSILLSVLFLTYSSPGNTQDMSVVENSFDSYHAICELRFQRKNHLSRSELAGNKKEENEFLHVQFKLPSLSKDFFTCDPPSSKPDRLVFYWDDQKEKFINSPIQLRDDKRLGPHFYLLHGLTSTNNGFHFADVRFLSYRPLRGGSETYKTEAEWFLSDSGAFDDVQSDLTPSSASIGNVALHIFRKNCERKNKNPEFWVYVDVELNSNGQLKNYILGKIAELADENPYEPRRGSTNKEKFVLATKSPIQEQLFEGNRLNNNIRTWGIGEQFQHSFSWVHPETLSFSIKQCKAQIKRPNNEIILANGQWSSFE